jgi:hypothetical protein
MSTFWVSKNFFRAIESIIYYWWDYELVQSFEKTTCLVSLLDALTRGTTVYKEMCLGVFTATLFKTVRR